jgi:hypothetical protein
MLTGPVTLMIERLHRLTLCFLAAILSPRVRKNRGLLFDPLRKLNIVHLLMALQKHYGFLHFFMNSDFLWQCHLLYCVIILAQLTLVSILFTTQEWSISKLIFILCVIKFRRVFFMCAHSRPTCRFIDQTTVSDTNWIITSQNWTCWWKFNFAGAY